MPVLTYLSTRQLGHLADGTRSLIDLNRAAGGPALLDAEGTLATVTDILHERAITDRAFREGSELVAGGFPNMSTKDLAIAATGLTNVIEAFIGQALGAELDNREHWHRMLTLVVDELHGRALFEFGAYKAQKSAAAPHPDGGCTCCGAGVSQWR